MSQNRPNQFLNAIRGSTLASSAILFAGSTIMTSFLTGAAIDFGRAYGTRARIQSVSDSTALLLVREPRGTYVGQLQAIAEQRIESLLGKDLPPDATVSVTVVGPSLRVAVNFVIPTMFIKLILQDAINMGVSSTADYAKAKTQIASSKFSGRMNHQLSTAVYGNGGAVQCSPLCPNWRVV